MALPRPELDAITRTTLSFNPKSIYDSLPTLVIELIITLKEATLKRISRQVTLKKGGR
jgi:hypothetical protein